MKKRFACLLLALVMLVGLIPAGVVTASADASAISAAGIKVIKEYVGFHKEAYLSGAEYLIGYGTPSVKDATITEAKADLYLREKLAVLDVQVQAVAPKLVQKQHDALVWYSYIYGNGLLSSPSWMNKIVNGTTSSEIANAFCTWDYAGGYPATEAAQAVVTSRMAMANLYINGVYSATATGSFAMTVFEANGGAFAGGVKNMVQVFDSKQTSEIVTSSVPTLAGQSFLGWYLDNGDKTYSLVTGLGSSTAGKVLYARWTADSYETPCSYQLPASVIYEATGSSEVIVRKDVSDLAEKIDVLKREDTINVVGELLIGSVKWLHLSTGGWVKLGNVGTTPTITAGLNVSVTDDFVNIRKNPTAGSEKLGILKRGEVVTIIMTATDASGNLWGYCSKGWICLMYTDYNERTSEHKETTDNTNDTVVATGTVNCGSTMNVRRNPNTSSTKLGTLSTGARVEIYEITSVGGHKWGRIKTGWICLDYVDLDSTPVTNTANTTTTPGSGIPGVVVGTDELNVRSGAGVGNNKVTTISVGTRVTVYETVTVDGAQWGRIDKGWVSLEYIKMDEAAAVNTSASGTVSSTVSLAVRTGPGSEYAKTASLAPGAKVTITQKQTVKGVTWGKIEQGWINLSYVTMTSANTVNGIAGTVVGCSTGVKVRSDAGTQNSLLGVAALGSRVVVTERKQVNGIYWGHIATGWVCMDYIQLDSEWVDPKPVESATTTVVTTEFAGYPGKMISDCALRESASSDAKTLLTLKTGAVVSILDRKAVGEKEFGKVKVGTITGWVDMSTVKMDDLNAFVSAAKAEGYEQPNTRSTFYGALVQGTPVVITEQTLDGSVLWGKVQCKFGHDVHTAYIKMSTVTMYPNNQMPSGVTVANGVGYLTGAIKSGATALVYKDSNGDKSTAATDYTLVEGHRVSILSRLYIGTQTWAKISIGNTIGWIDMSLVDLDPVELKVTESGFKLYNAINGAAVDTLVKDDHVTVITRALATYANGINDWGYVYINDDAAHLYWIILNEGKLANVSNAPADSGVATEVLTSVVVNGVAPTGTKVYEEAIDSTDTKVLLQLNTSANVTVLNWKNAGGKTWGKVKIGTIIGWVKIDEVDFSALHGTVAVDELKVYGKADVDSAVEVLRVKDRAISITQMEFDGKILWGYITVAEKYGWVNLAEMKLVLGAPSTASTAILTGKINSVDKNVTVLTAPSGAPGVVSIPKNTVVNLVEVFVDANGAWFKVDLGSADKNGWVNLESIAMNPAIAVVNDVKLDVLDDLTAMTKVVYTLYRGEKITITNFLYHGGSLYGEVTIGDTTGWILVCSDINYKPVSLTPGTTSNPVGNTTNNSTTETAPSTPVETPAPSVQPQAAYIVCSDTVKVRSGAGVEYAQIGALKNGTVINVYEQVTASNGSQWVHIGPSANDGWVCVDYVRFGTTNTSANSAAMPTVITTVPAGAIAAGYANEDVKIRSGAGMGYEVVSTVKKNNALVIYEKKLDGGMSWGRTDNGWVCLSYLTITAIGNSGNMGTIAGVGFTARVRNTAGINGAEMAKVMVTSRVAIYEETVVSGESWGRTDLGWINMMYVVMDTVTAPAATAAENASEVG